MKHFVLMCLLLYIHTSQSEIHSQRSTEGCDVSLYCKHEGKVQWFKDRDGNRLMILTAESKEKIEKLSPDPHNRYSVLDDLSLHIKNLSVSDSGIYYCNKNPTVSLTVTASGETRSTTSSNSQATTPPPEISISTISLGVNTNVAQTSNTHHTDQPKSTQATPTSENSNVHNSGSQTNTPVTSTTDLSTTSTRSSTRTEETNIMNTTLSVTSTTSRATTPAPPPTESSKIASAVSGGVVFVVLVLVLLLWACIKRKDISAALSNKKENIYETVGDSDFTTQPVPSQKPKDAIYYLAGDPDIVQLGQIKETDDHTYTLISQSKENITEREDDVPLYSTIKVDTIN